MPGFPFEARISITSDLFNCFDMNKTRKRQLSVVSIELILVKTPARIHFRMGSSLGTFKEKRNANF